jgi:hypothetical protein
VPKKDSPMKKKGQKERLKPISLYGLDPREVIKAFMSISPKRMKELEEEDRRCEELNCCKKEEE